MKIFVNPGHAPNGDPDPGAVNAKTGLRECDIVQAIGSKAAEYLEAAGCETQVLQSDSLNELVSTANDWPADLFVSIHCNSADNDIAQGTETWFFHNSQEGRKLAGCIQRQIVSSLPVVDRGLKEAIPGVNGLYVLTNTDMPAVLVETAFISSENDERLLTLRQDDFARAIARGITDYFAVQEI
jgi:N-acetylmuramoyl-L-alanine amidase